MAAAIASRRTMRLSLLAERLLLFFVRHTSLRAIKAVSSVDPKRVPDIRWTDEWARSAGSSLVAPSATTTPTPVSATTSAVPASASVTATAPSAFTRAGFIDYNVAAHEVLAV
jgi:hypothetical protein